MAPPTSTAYSGTPLDFRPSEAVQVDLGALPERVTIDNAKCAITKACAKDPTVQRARS